tara:strand:+ start:1189 stop:4302 length:3114 start_codon:yes stop_codon:yes gene_type:complete
MESEKMVGLRPYRKEEADIFYGREKEVEGLLQILQKDKLVTVIGAPGTGKSSLINAGLIPRLEEGFLAQAGKQWSVCKFRPGISPIENMAYSLTSTGGLTLDGKSNTEDFSDYHQTLKDLGSLGLVQIYTKSEVNNKKNLLIVIDQLEDLFKFNRYFDHEKSEQDDLLINILARTTKIKETAIYFAIVIQSDYVSYLSQYAKLQEIISKSQYAVPNFSKAGIKEIIENNFLDKGISFSNKAFKSIVDIVLADPTFLPNMQFLFQQIRITKNVNSNQKVEPVDIESLGGVENCLKFAFEGSYQELSEVQKNHFEKICKALYTFDIDQDSRYAQIMSISKVTALSVKEISDVIFIFKSKVNQSFEIIPRAITGVEKNNKKTLDLDDIINNKYLLQRNWEREITWQDEEEESFKSFKTFSEITENFNSGKASLLFTPELELAKEWVENKFHNSNWAKKYRFNFKNTVDFIYKSIRFHEENREREENRLRRKRKTTRLVVSVMSVLILIASALAIRSYFAERRAIESKEIADLNAREAIKQREKAGLEREKSDSLRIVAVIAQENAEYDKILALEAQEKAEKARTRALIANKKANQQAEIAQKQKLVADTEREHALNEKKNADKAREESENRRKIAQIESEFYPIVRKMERLVEYENASDELYQNKVFEAIDEALNKYKEHFQIQKDIYGTSEDTEGTYMILQTALRVLEGKNSYNETSMMLYRMRKNTAIRSIDSYGGSILAFGGDDGTLNILNTINKSNLEIPINERIRKIRFINPNNILIGTFEGDVFRVDLSQDFEKDKETLLFSSKNPIVDIQINSSSNDIIVFTDKEVVFLDDSENSSNIQKVSFKIKGVDFNGDQLFFASNNEVFLYNGENIISLPLQFDYLANEEILTFNFSKEFLFIGTESGKIFTYINNGTIDGRTPLEYLGTLVLHRSGITKLYFDEENNSLYSASFDNQILRYKIEKSNFDNAVRDFISLSGHEKWVWDLSLTKNPGGKELIVTVDENGNVLTWFKNLEDLANKVESLLNEQKKILPNS